MTKSLDQNRGHPRRSFGKQSFHHRRRQGRRYGFRRPSARPGSAAKTTTTRATGTLEDFRAQIRDVVRQGIVDIMLLSASNVEILAMEERLFENSAVTPAARANDTSDIWAVRGGKYRARHRDVSHGDARPYHVWMHRSQAQQKIAGAAWDSIPSRLPITLTRNTMRCASSMNFDSKPSGRVFAISSKCSIPTSSLGFLKRIFQPSSMITLFAPWPASGTRTAPFPQDSLPRSESAR